jgi:DNA-binding transcriptional ArsR family regulator
VEPTGDEVLQVSTAEQYAALGHPMRLRLLFALGQRSATISQLARALHTHKGSIAHHLKVLREAGLVRLEQTRSVRGGTEQYFVRSARRFDFTGEEASAYTAMAIRTVGEEMAAAPTAPYVTLRHIRLTQAQADELTATLTDLVESLTEADDAEPRYGLLLGLYRHRDPAA